MYRHIRQFCQAAKTAADNQLVVNQVDQPNALESLQKAVEALTVKIAQFDKPTQVQTSNSNNATNNGSIAMAGGAVNNNTINIIPWDGERCINVSTADIIAAFTTNPKLQEYSHLPAAMISDREKAAPYVSEMLMDLVKRTHQNPAARNVYLNPRRGDQALVHLREGRWQVVALSEASDMLLQGVALAIHRVTMSHEEIRALPIEAQHALAVSGLLYQDEPDEYARRVTPRMTAHLTNMAEEHRRDNGGWTTSS